MKKLWFLTFILSFPAFAGSLLLYPKTNQSENLKQYLGERYKNAQSVFTSTEKNHSILSYSSLHAMKLTVPDQEIEFIYKDARLIELCLKIESNSKLSLQSDEYSHLQWGMYNPGESLTIKLSDIESMQIPGLVGEDIQIKGLEENKQRKIRVAVVDSGIDLLHPDLKDVVYTNPAECEAQAEYQKCLEENEDDKICEEKWAQHDSDGNGYPMDCHGWNVAAPINETTNIQGNFNVTDLIGHGTFVAGIIGARENGSGVSGVIQNVEILPVKVSGSEEEVEEENATDIFAKGLLYALKTGAQIINLSVGWASNEDSLLVTEIIARAQEMGVLVIVAGGNSAHSNITYPCSYNEVICVGAHNPDGSLTHFSNRGTSIDLLAPGRKILSTWPLELQQKQFVQRRGFEYKDGTSFSAPFVAGLAARLLNLGFTSDEARVKLLSGTRKKHETAPLVLNGAADLKKSINSQTTSFIYPYKKTPAMINWSKENKKLVVKLKNYLAETNGVTIQLISKTENVSVTSESFTFANWNRDEIKEMEFFVSGLPGIESDLEFELKIQSSDEDKSYPVQAMAITLIHEDFKRDDTDSFKIQAPIGLANMTLRPFENIMKSETNDFLVVDTSEKKVRLALLKNIDGNYRLSPPFATEMDKPFFSHLVRIDLDQDAKEDYVVVGFYPGEKEEDWNAKFFVFDSKFRKKDYEICPKNEFDNKLTTLNDRITWLKIENQIVPAWIASGYLPAEELSPLIPWQIPEENKYRGRLYYFTKERIHTLKIGEDDLEILPLSFFPQTKEERANFDVTLLFSQSFNFKRSYFKTKVSNLSQKELLTQSRFHNISKLEPVKGSDTEIVFSETSTNLLTRVTSFHHDENLAHQDYFQYQDLLDPIQMIFSKNANGSYFALTKYHLLYLNQSETIRAESRNTDQLVRYQPIKKLGGLYLPAMHTPGIASEVITLNEKNSSLMRNSSYRTVLYGSCLEIGLTQNFWADEEFLTFYCDQNKTFHFIHF